MICPYCGKENPDDKQSCGFCGGPLAVPDKESATEALPVEPPISVDQPSIESPFNNAAQSQSSLKPATGIYGNRIWWIVGCFLIAGIILGCGALAWGLFRITSRQTKLNPATVTPAYHPSPTVVKISVPSPSPDLNPLAKLTFTPTSMSSTRSLIFSDDFSDPGSGWDRVDQADFYSDYFENAYRIIVHSDMSDSWANPDDNVFGDVFIEVDATKNGGPDDNDYGVICRYQSQDQFYYGVISSDGYYGITKVTSKASSLLGRDSLAYSAAIDQGLTTNHIRFDCYGDVLTLFVNGQQVDRQTDSEYTSGNVGLIAGTYDTPGTDILFDNFFVYKP